MRTFGVLTISTEGGETMLTNQTIEKLRALKLTGMLKALEEQMAQEGITELDFLERFGLLVDREIAQRENRRLKTRLRAAKLRESASMEDINYRHPRGLERSLMASLGSCTWISSARNVIITGATGVGKTYIACALAQKAMREGFSALYRRTPRLLRDLSVARVDGSYHKTMTALAKSHLLVLDDWGLSTLNSDQEKDLLEIIEDRHGLKSTVITSQLPVEAWHQQMANPTIADAILDRVVHNAYRINLSGESMRKVYAKKDEPT
jgi:DNA replication protein DnaC